MGELDKLISSLFLEKMPPLSPGAKNSAVRTLPWLFMIFGALGLFAVLSSIISLSFTSMLAMGIGQVMGMSIPALGFIMIYLFTPLTQLLSITGGYYMLRRKYLGWQLAVLATYLSFFTHILYLSTVGLILDVLFLYLLYQIRDRYVV